MQQCFQKQSLPQCCSQDSSVQDQDFKAQEQDQGQDF